MSLPNSQEGAQTPASAPPKPPASSPDQSPSWWALAFALVLATRRTTAAQLRVLRYGLPWRLRLLWWRGPRHRFFETVLTGRTIVGHRLWRIAWFLRGIAGLLLYAALIIVLPLLINILATVWIGAHIPAPVTISFPGVGVSLFALIWFISGLAAQVFLSYRLRSLRGLFRRPLAQRPSVTRRPSIWGLFVGALTFWLVVNVAALIVILRTGGTWQDSGNAPAPITSAQSSGAIQQFWLVDPPGISYGDIVLASAATIALAGLTTIVTLALQIYSQRQRHIIYQLEYQPSRLAREEHGSSSETRQQHVSDAEERDLRSAALTLTHLLSRHVQRVGRLMSQPQVESLRTQVETPLELFVRSGQEEVLVQQLEQLGELQISSVVVPYGRLLGFILANRADTRVRGSVHRNKDGATEVWLSVYSRRHGQTFDLGRKVIQRPPGNEAVGEAELDGIAMHFAIRVARALLNNPNLGSSVESLAAFVDGLESSASRNWWHAISNYQRAIAIEEASRTTFATAHYHIGATLLLQGEPRLALEQLRMAESRGAQNPEVLYTIALALFTLHFKDLHRRDSPEVHAAIGYLHSAVQRNRNFQEAHHLLGIIYYNRGRQSERISRDGTDTDAYATAERWLRQAYARSEAQIERLLRQQRRSEHASAELVKAVRAHLMIAHHWADSLRSLGFYGLASLLYTDAQLAFNGNSRNQIDRLLTHCLQRSWKKGERLFNAEVRSTGSALWSADVQLYYGWLNAGKATWVLPDRASLWRALTSLDLTLPHRESLRRAFTSLDLALLLRPRFAQPRRQTDWTMTWVRALHRWRLWRYLPGLASIQPAWLAQTPPIEPNGDLANDVLSSFQQVIYAPGLLPDDKRQQSAARALRDLSLRLRVYSLHAPTVSHDPTQRFGDLDPRQEPLWTIYGHVLHRYQHRRHEAAQILFESDQQGKLFGTAVLQRRHELAQQVYEDWKQLYEHWSPVATGADIEQWLVGQQILERNHEGILLRRGIPFGLRWSLDVFIQYSLLACQLFAYCSMSAFLSHVADTSRNLQTRWIALWRDVHGSDAVLYSAPVLRFYLVTLDSWWALAELRMGRRTHAGGPPTSDMERLKVLHGLQKTAAEVGFVQHPLYLYVSAEYYRICGMHSEAASSLHELLTVTDAYEARPFNPFNFTVGMLRETLIRRDTALIDEGERTRLLYYERVSGQQQFEFFVNSARVHARLAEIAVLDGNERAAVGHLFSALTWSPYADFDLQNFVKLVRTLLDMASYREALAALEEAKTRLGSYPVDHVEYGNLLELDVIECIILTRLGLSSHALEKALALIRHETIGYPRSAGGDGSVANAAQTQQPPRRQSPRRPVAATTSSEAQRIDSVVSLFGQLFTQLQPLEGRYSFEVRAASTLAQRLLDRWVRPYIQQGRVPEYDDRDPTELDGYRHQAIHRRQELYASRRIVFSYIFQFCELHNTIAYNLALLEIKLDIALQYAWTAIHVMEDLLRQARSANPSRAAERVERFSERLAQYYDTLAWIFYRRRATHQAPGGLSAPATSSASQLSAQNVQPAWDVEESLRLLDVLCSRQGDAAQAPPTPTAVLGTSSQQPGIALPDLHQAIYFLERKSLVYAQYLSVPHYHLSRAYLALAEEFWLDRELRGHASWHRDAQLRQYVHRASRYWETARDLDGNQRLTIELRRQRQRIDALRDKLREPFAPAV